MGAGSELHQVVAELFFIQFSAVWWDTPKVRASPLELLRSWAARSNASLVCSLGRRDSKTPPRPQDLHLYLGLPTPLLPFFTNLSLPQC